MSAEIPHEHACADCVARSVLRCEGLVHAETRLCDTRAAADLLRLPPEQLREVLAAERPTLSSEVAEWTARIDRWAGEEDQWTLCVHCADFPDRFRHFERPSDLPAVIYGVGDRGLLSATAEGSSLAVVGARRASAYGREVAYSLARDAAEVGLPVVSGMALGIDGAAHRGALQGGGATLAVLAGGPDRPYPRSHRLLHEQICDSGCVISESPPESTARRWAFVARNRLIAALADLTVFVEGAVDSGARHTVSFAADLGLGVGAVPGPVSSPMSAGPNALLAASGATLIRGIDDVLDELGLTRLPVGGEVGAVESLSDLERTVLEAVAAGARTPRELVGAVPEHSPRELAGALGVLELAGRLVREASGEYRLA